MIKYYSSILLFGLFLFVLLKTLRAESSVYAKKMDIYNLAIVKDSFLSHSFREELLGSIDGLCFKYEVVCNLNIKANLTPEDFISTAMGVLVEDYFNYDINYKFENDSYTLLKVIKMGQEDVFLRLSLIEENGFLVVDDVNGLNYFLEKANDEFLYSKNYSCN